MLLANYSGYGNYHDFVSDQLDDLAARLQARVGQFLQLKAILTQLKQSSNPNIAAKANALYIRQTSLETLLTVNTAKLDKLKVSGLSIAAIPDIASIANFASAMESQIKDVENLNDQSKGIAPVTSSIMTFAPPMKKIAVIIGIFAVGFVVYKAVK